MKVVLAIDALEYNLVKEFNCKNLMQGDFGKTDIDEFEKPRTMVLWSSFMTGENKEEEVLKNGNEEMWNKKWEIEETFFSNFSSPKIIDLPGFSYDLDAHKKSRELLKKYFGTEDKEDMDEIKKKYNQDALNHHKKIKSEFLKSLGEEGDFVLGYFSVIDVIGHLNFGNTSLMKMLYEEMDEIAKRVEKELLILSDHGMKKIGRYGDHSEYGFWSFKKDLGTPKITDFAEIIEKW
jgi:hypothetical protein